MAQYWRVFKLSFSNVIFQCKFIRIDLIFSPLVDEGVVWEHMSVINAHRSMSPDGMHPRVLRKLAEVIAKPFSIIFERSSRTDEVPEDWRIANAILIFKKGKKENPGNNRPVSLTAVPGKVLALTILPLLANFEQHHSPCIVWRCCLFWTSFWSS